MSIYDTRMIQLIKILQTLGTITYQFEFADSLGMHKQALTQIKTGKGGFTPAQILTACKLWKVNANWIFGIEKEVFIKNVYPNV